MRRKKHNSNRVEIYEIDRSPLSRRPTQRDIGILLGETRDDLRRLVNYKESYVVRRQIVSGKKGKVRDLAYPEGRLRAVHERLKFQLSKIKQPGYLFSPRRKKGQRDNAVLHLDQKQYLTLDLKQFYPSTTSEMVKRWFIENLKMYPDVAGLLTRLCTIDDEVSFGSPVTPVLCSLVHRPMFDEIAEICERRGLRYSVWVDDLTISGKFVPGEVLDQIRAVIRLAGLKSHRIVYRTGERPVFITGIGVVGAKLVAPNSLNLRIKDLWRNYHSAVTVEEIESTCQCLLSHLGTLRHISGRTSKLGRKAADQMNSLRQDRDHRIGSLRDAKSRDAATQFKREASEDEDLPWA
jgi:RNA-directed DNA polymerase